MSQLSKKPNIDIEEILLDKMVTGRPNNKLEKLEAHLSSQKFLLFFVIITGFLVILYARVFYLQVARGSYFYKLSEDNKTRYVPIKAARGLILDRYGNNLVENQTTLSLILSPRDLLQNSHRDATIEKVKEIFSLEGDWDSKYKDESKSNFGFDPVLLETNVSVEEARRFESEISSEDKNGFYLIEDYSRHYLDDEAFSHLIGYTGKMDQNDIKNHPEYPVADIIGKMGLESYYEKFLHGVSGKRIMEVNAKSEVSPYIKEEPAQPGNNLVTTVDRELQTFFYQTLKEATDDLHIHKAAGIITNPKTGEMLALVSLPAVNANALTKGYPVKEVRAMLENSHMPFLNRVISGLYAPGSTIKPLVALAALEEKTIDPSKKIRDEDAIIIPNPYDPNKPSIFRDWKNHGIVDMKSAIANSCNIYFYALGGGYKDIKGLGIQKLKEYWEKFYLGNILGIDLYGEKKGVLPDPEWKKVNKPDDPVWRLGDTYNVSIGQGDLLVTPLELAFYLGALANEGKIMKPYIVSKIIDNNKNIVYNAAPRVLSELKFQKENFKIVKEGMRGVVTIGSAQMLKDLDDMKVAGKTGTPQIEQGKKTNALFAAFAPYEDPDILVLVLLEEPPQGSVVAIPVVDKVMRWYHDNRYQK